MSRAFYVLIFLVAINLVITIIGFVNQSATSSQVVYVPAAADKSSPAAAAAPAVPTIAVKKPDDKILRDMIQTVLKQELAPYSRQLAAASGITQKILSPESTNVKENSATNIQSFTEATNIVENAIAQGVWTPDDSTQLLQQAGNLSNAQKEKITEKMVRAVNEQQLKLGSALPAL